MSANFSALSAAPQPDAALSSEERLRRLHAMLLARAFEAALLAQPKPGFQLLSRGEEAVSVGVCSALRASDPMLCHGRSIALASINIFGVGRSAPSSFRSW